ncbi:MAG: hypothetical protein ABIN80_06265 [Dyadobacter sp.]
MLQTVTVDIINDKAINLLMDLERLKLIRLRREVSEPASKIQNVKSKYKGAMSKQSVSDIERQLGDLRNEWE